jgi:hypothetical protein
MKFGIENTHDGEWGMLMLKVKLEAKHSSISFADVLAGAY